MEHLLEIQGVNQNVIPQRTQNNFHAGPRNNQETLVEYKEKNDATIQNLASSMRNLEIQNGQLTNALSNIPQGALPSDKEDAKQPAQCQEK
ncbi:hypothetical protein V6N13_124983 [Hibiscus sabdariffa]